MTKRKWTMDQMPRQDGKTVVVTGANSGLGFHTARMLSLKGAKVIMACRNREKGLAARKRILEGSVASEPEVWQLDLASMQSVRQFAQKIHAAGMPLDLLINNAGLMAIPRSRTEEGFEMQFGVNHLGHFALTALLWPVLSAATGSRVVQLSSLAHILGKIRFQDIHWEKAYNKWSAYAMSKLANLLFVQELAGRLSENGSAVTALAAHPGYSDTELQAKGARMQGRKLGAAGMNLINKLIAQSGEMGALPTLYAATAENVKQGDYFGPGGLLKLRGLPAPDSPSGRAFDREVSQRLWEVSESLTGIEFRV